MSIIVAFPNIENGRNIRRILQQNGFVVTAVCTSGAQALQCAQNLPRGMVICGYRLTDMVYRELYEALLPGFEMLLIASAGVCESRECQQIPCLTTPLRAHDLIETVGMMEGGICRSGKKGRAQKKRSEEEKKLLWDAKALLMDRNHMTEEQAHRYLQKCSMDNGMGLAETAQMIVCLWR